MARLLINNKSYLVNEEADTPLLWVLRENLQLTGTKFGCGGGHCGACTVHINGEAVRSCQIRVDDIDGAVITTIEGLSTSGDHPVQQAWLENQVPQCGFANLVRSCKQPRYSRITPTRPMRKFSVQCEESMPMYDI